jgi:flagellar hook protein FlgE
MTAIQSALTGMQQADSQLDATASRIANSPFPTVPGAQNPQDLLDLSSEMVSLMQARTDFSANTKVVHVADEMHKSTLSMLG